MHTGDIKQDELGREFSVYKNLYYKLTKNKNLKYATGFHNWASGN